MKIIARIYTDFPQKFGIPRQSGMVKELEGTIVFEPEYRDEAAVRGLEGFSHIWLLWEFSENIKEGWSPTVRPPRLGGDKRVGVFATRSPFRPNPIGLSCVKLNEICKEPGRGVVLHVSGVDIMDGTPIYDIKPYLPHSDCHPEAQGGFAKEFEDYGLDVEFSDKLLSSVPESKRKGLIGALRNDPRPSYQNDPARIYGMTFAGLNVKFTVDGEILTVISVEKNQF
ncbi:MAG: tRNA (N6-threonylcarbamoyladenosine(37)-N6)-methyltransferase TrmO [Butyrivibrio sp.]